MKTYVATTGIVFAMLALAHVWRVVFENPALARQPDFIVITLVAVLLSLWALLVLRKSA